MYWVRRWRNWSKAGRAWNMGRAFILLSVALLSGWYVSPSLNKAQTLTWTATGDDGDSGTACRYEFRAAQRADSLTADNWQACREIYGAALPESAGVRQGFAIGDFVRQQPAGESLFVAVLAVDDAGLEGPISNIARFYVAIGIAAPGGIRWIRR